MHDLEAVNGSRLHVIMWHVIMWHVTSVGGWNSHCCSAEVHLTSYGLLHIHLALPSKVVMSTSVVGTMLATLYSSPMRLPMVDPVHHSKELLYHLNALCCV